MKILKMVMFSATFAAMGLFVSSCGGENKTEENTEQTAEQGKEYTSAYVCPMHCKGSGSDKAGTCPECNMDYVKNEGETGEEAAHDHEGHDHEGHEH